MPVGSLGWDSMEQAYRTQEKETGRNKMRMCFHVVHGWWTQTHQDLQRSLRNISQNHLPQGWKEDLSTGSWLSLVKHGLWAHLQVMHRVPMSLPVWGMRDAFRLEAKVCGRHSLAASGPAGMDKWRDWRDCVVTYKMCLLHCCSVGREIWDLKLHAQ